MSSTEHDTHDRGAERRPSYARNYRHVSRLVFDTPWALLESTYLVICEVTAMHLHGEVFTDEEIEERIGAAKPRQAGGQRGAVAVIPVYGVVMPRADAFSKMSGATDLEQIGAMIDQAAADPQVASILLDIDSPGGSVALVPETAAKIRKARQSKPVVAIANTDAASAAYWLAAQADELVVSPSGSVGSVGVFAAHVDRSGMQEKLGLKTTLISAGKYKVEANPFEPLTAEAQAAIQTDVDAFYSMFKADVAKGRGTTATDVEQNFGQGRMVMAKAAVTAGMADRIDTFEGALRRLMDGKVQPRNGRTASGVITEQEIKAAVAAEPDAPKAQEEPHEDHEPAGPVYVEGADQLARHAAIREHFAPVEAG